MNKPFLLKPSGKDYLWGGNRINDDYGKDINLSPLAESWECSVHEDGCDQAFYQRKNRAFFLICSKSKDSGGRTGAIFLDSKIIDQKTCVTKLPIFLLIQFSPS